MDWFGLPLANEGWCFTHCRFVHQEKPILTFYNAVLVTMNVNRSMSKQAAARKLLNNYNLAL